MPINSDMYMQYAQAMPNRSNLATGLSSMNRGFGDEQKRRAIMQAAEMQRKKNEQEMAMRQALMQREQQKRQNFDAQMNDQGMAINYGMPYNERLMKAGQFDPQRANSLASLQNTLNPAPTRSIKDGQVISLNHNGSASASPISGYQTDPQKGWTAGMKAFGVAHPGSSAIEAYNGSQSAKDNRATLVGGGNPLPAAPGNKKFLETTGTLQANRLDEMTKNAQMAVERSYGVQVQRSLISNGFKTGKLAPFFNGVSAIAEGLGVDPSTIGLPDPSLGQAFDMTTFKNLLDALKAQKGPQTEGDANRALKTFSSMKNTEEANMFILDYMDELSNRTQQMVDFIDERAYGKYATSNRPVSLAEKDYRKWARNHPVIATSAKSGLPITYSKYKQAAIDSGIPESEVDDNWREFAGVK